METILTYPDCLPIQIDGPCMIDMRAAEWLAALAAAGCTLSEVRAVAAGSGVIQ